MQRPYITEPHIQPINDEDWTPFKENIRRLYWIENKTVDQVVIAMKDTYNFFATYVLLISTRLGVSSVDFDAEIRTGRNNTRINSQNGTWRRM